MEDHFALIFSILIIIAAIDLWIVVEISKFPIKYHRNKRKWTKIVLRFPLFGILAYYFSGKKTFEEEL